MLPGMALLTVLAMFIPQWSNLQLIGSAITFVQVAVILFRVKTTPNSPHSFGLVLVDFGTDFWQFIIIGVSLVSHPRESEMATG